MYSISSNFWILALYGSWEAGNSFKILSWDVRTFSTIEHFILRTFIFRHLLDSRSPTPKCDPPIEKQVALSPNQPDLELDLHPSI